jgi:hypothetical protein
MQPVESVLSGPVERLLSRDEVESVLSHWDPWKSECTAARESVLPAESPVRSRVCSPGGGLELALPPGPW